MRYAKQGIKFYPYPILLPLPWQLLRKDFGAKGFVAALDLVAYILSQDYWAAWEDEHAELFALNHRYEDEFVAKVVDAMFKRKIFDRNLFEKYSILTSAEIQENWEHAMKKSKRAELTIVEKFILLQQTKENPKCGMFAVTRNLVNPCNPNNLKNSGNIPEDSGNIPEDSAVHGHNTDTTLHEEDITQHESKLNNTALEDDAKAQTSQTANTAVETIQRFIEFLDKYRQPRQISQAWLKAYSELKHDYTDKEMIEIFSWAMAKGSWWKDKIGTFTYLNNLDKFGEKRLKRFEREMNLEKIGAPLMKESMFILKCKQDRTFIGTCEGYIVGKNDIRFRQRLKDSPAIDFEIAFVGSTDGNHFKSDKYKALLHARHKKYNKNN